MLASPSIERSNCSIQSTRRVLLDRVVGPRAALYAMHHYFPGIRITIWQKRIGASCVHFLRMRPTVERSVPGFGERSTNSTHANAQGFNRSNIDETARQRRWVKGSNEVFRTHS